MNHQMKRRTLLKGTLAAGVAAVAAGAGLLTPRAVLAAWPKAAFEAKKLDQAITTLLGNTALTESKDIKLKTPAIAENGAVVNVTVNTKLPDVDSISILVEKNAMPLAVTFDLSARTKPYVKTRVKVAKTSGVMAVVRSGGKLYSARREVKVTLGGCGG